MTAAGLVAVRGGTRAIIRDEHRGYSLGRYVAGQLPHHYRAAEGIASDFLRGHSALEAVLAMAASMPTSTSFQNSHCGEIIAAHFVEDHLGFRRLYSKLTMLTAENTNAHKMDGLFVKIGALENEYLFVEAKSSILPTEATPHKSHRSGILKQMISSLDGYSSDDPRFELARIRDNLETSFSKDEANRIHADLIPPGPDNLKFLGVSVTNSVTVNEKDDDFILSEACLAPFDYYALVVTDLSAVAAESYGIWAAGRKAMG
ncbi:Hachiman antiphage defense system protein HamA [uncultured Sphingomonas sp.]|uniref:Hachiman antiphage defense system protein HamA n=1 Tax=uncultured Sphingomonas sp. TaxID=158754 RepID=UPI0025F7B16B|nr:Hachiman antiphage defense system protein HamA [uncultured Sphingomonas sp.]